MDKAEIIDVQHLESENQIVIIKRIKSNRTYMVHPPRPVPDKVWKEIWGVENGIITLVEQVQGQHEPQHMVEEKFIFEDGAE